MKKALILLIINCFVIIAYSQTGQEGEKNIVLGKVSSEYSFVKGNGNYPVQVKEETEKKYTCKNYRTDIPFAELYNDMSTIDDITIYVDGSKKNGVIPRFDYYDANGIFYSDAHVCHFILPLTKMNATSEVHYKKTTLDPRYFTNIYFMDDYNIEEEEIKLSVPSWMNIEIKEFNFKGYSIEKSSSNDGDATIYLYKMKNIPAMPNESSAVTNNSNRCALIFRKNPPFSLNRSVELPGGRILAWPASSSEKLSGASSNVRDASVPFGPRPGSFSVSVFGRLLVLICRVPFA